jgi:hypothetical protein
MTIKRSGIAEPISAKIDSNEKPKYCPVCERHSQRYALHNRLYKEIELQFGMLPGDHDRWLQCFHCGNVFLKDNVRQEGKLTTDIQIPKASGSSVGKPEHYEKPKHRRGFNERLDRGQEEIKDPELRKELKKGAKLISYSEH